MSHSQERCPKCGHEHNRATGICACDCCFDYPADSKKPIRYSADTVVAYSYYSDEEGSYREGIPFKHATDEVQTDLLSVESLRAKLKRAEEALDWALEWIADGTDASMGETPDHDCEYNSNPEKGDCDFHQKYFDSVEALAELRDGK